MRTNRTKTFADFSNVLSIEQLQSIQCGVDPTDCEGGQIISLEHGGVCMDPAEVGGIDVDGCSDIGLP